MQIQLDLVDPLLMAFPPIGAFVAALPLVLHGRKQGWTLGMQIGVPISAAFVFLVLAFVDSAAASIVASFALMFSLVVAAAIFGLKFLRKKPG